MIMVHWVHQENTTLYLKQSCIFTESINSVPKNTYSASMGVWIKISSMKNVWTQPPDPRTSALRAEIGRLWEVFDPHPFGLKWWYLFQWESMLKTTRQRTCRKIWDVPLWPLHATHGHGLHQTYICAMHIHKYIHIYTIYTHIHIYSTNIVMKTTKTAHIHFIANFLILQSGASEMALWLNSHCSGQELKQVPRTHMKTHSALYFQWQAILQSLGFQEYLAHRWNTFIYLGKTNNSNNSKTRHIQNKNRQILFKVLKFIYPALKS